MKLLIPLAIAATTVSSLPQEKGTPSDVCGSLIPFLSQHDAFPDNTYIKYKHRGKRTFAQVTCMRLRRKATPADKSARSRWEKTLSKSSKKGKFLCNLKKNAWKVKGPGAPLCADRDSRGSWASHFLKKDFQIKADESEGGKCLTFSTEETMAAYNPDTGSTGVYPLAVWEDCKEKELKDPSQTFTWDLHYRLKAGPADEPFCLTPLPISVYLHENLDYCDRFSHLNGAGTYLFAVPCGEVTEKHQQYKYNKQDGMFESQCDHKFALGKVENEGHKAFLTSDVDSFPSAEVFHGLGVGKNFVN